MKDRLHAIANLPEPARSVAIDTVKLMKEGGATSAEANETALGLASEWVSERAPADQSHVSVPDESIPDRVEIAPAEEKVKHAPRIKTNARRSRSA